VLRRLKRPLLYRLSYALNLFMHDSYMLNYTRIILENVNVTMLPTYMPASDGHEAVALPHQLHGQCCFALLCAAALHYLSRDGEGRRRPSADRNCIADSRAPTHRNRRIPNLKFQELCGIGWHVSYCGWTAGTPRRHRFGNAEREREAEARVLCHAWVSEENGAAAPTDSAVPDSRQSACAPVALSYVTCSLWFGRVTNAAARRLIRS
jgi:hypothetical protein